MILIQLALEGIVYFGLLVLGAPMVQFVHDAQKAIDHGHHVKGYSEKRFKSALLRLNLAMTICVAIYMVFDITLLLKILLIVYFLLHGLIYLYIGVLFHEYGRNAIFDRQETATKKSIEL